MDLTAQEAAAIRFRGTRYAYDRLEVDRFRTRVIATLEAYEQALADADRRIDRLEKAQPRGAARWLAPDSARDQAPATQLGPASAVDPGGEADGAMDRFLTWLSRRRAEFEIEHIVSGAHEEARMIRALAGERAAAEIARLTEEARRGARDVTMRAARLASDTEDAAHRRAGEIIHAASERSGRDGADMDELSRRIVSLRSSIAAVQDRLDALADEGESSPRQEVIDLDLIDAGASNKARRRRKAGVAAAAEAVSEDDLEERVAKLRERLEG